MRKIIYGLFLIASMSVAFIACADRDLNQNLSETGLIDQNGNIVTNTLTVTNWVHITNEIDLWVTNIIDADGNGPWVSVTNNVTNVIWETNVVVPNLPDKPTDNYKIYVPWAGKGDGYYTVNYKDTARLKQLWLDQVQRKGVGDGRVFAIRNRANNRGEHDFYKVHKEKGYEAADYYYFNANGDIIYKPDNTVIKRFKGAVIVSYRNITEKKYGIGGNWGGVVKYNWQNTGKYTVGAIYEMAMSTEDARAKYLGRSRNDSFKNGDNPFKDGVFDFIAARMKLEYWNNGLWHENKLFERQYTEGFIEVLVMHPEASEGVKNAAGVHSYYAYHGVYNITGPYDGHKGFTDENKPYMINPNIYLGERPEYVVPLLNHSTAFTDHHEQKGWFYSFMPIPKDMVGR